MSQPVKNMNVKKMIQDVAEFKTQWTDRHPYAPPMLRTSQATLNAIVASLPKRDEPDCALAEDGPFRLPGGAMLHGVRIYVNDALAPGEWEDWQDGKWHRRTSI